MRPVVLAGALLLAAAAGATAQDATARLRTGIEAYRQLELERAASLLRRAVEDDALSADDRSRALAYLGATEVVRRRASDAAAAFRTLLLHDPAWRLDPLQFPSVVLEAFETVREGTKAVALRLPDRVTLGPAVLFTVRLIPTSRHEIDALILGPDGSVQRRLYAGAVTGPVDIAWDGRIEDEFAPAATYTLLVASRAGPDAVLRHVRIPLLVSRPAPDTLPRPPPLDPDVLLPEHRRGGGILPLAAGLAAGVATVALPPLLANDGGPEGIRVAIGGTLSLAGVIGFVTGRRDVPIPENIEANEQRRQAIADEIARVRAENRARREGAPLVIRTGPPARVEGDWR